MRASPLVAAAALMVAALAGGSSGETAGTVELVVSSNQVPNLWGEIYVVGADGRGRRDLSKSLFDDRDPAVDPAGRTVAFVSDRTGHNGIWTVRTDGTELREITEDVSSSFFAPSWDATGRWLLFGQSDGVCVVAAGGGTVERVLPGGAFGAWGPGDRIAAQVSQGVQVLTRTGRALWRVPGSRGLWSPGGHLAVQASQSATVVYDSTGRRTGQMKGAPLAWSPRGELLASTDTKRLWVSDVRGKVRDVLTATNGFPSVEWSPDGRKISYSTLAPKTYVELVYAVDVASGRKMRLPGLGPWSPDGRRIAYGSYAGVVRVAEGAATRVVARTGALIRSVHWLPGGRVLYWTAAAEQQTTAHLLAVRPSGGIQARLTKRTGIAWDSSPAWAPNGSRLAFSRGGALCNGGSCGRYLDNDLWVARADGSGLERLTRTPGELNTDDSDPVWSPDGGRIAFTRTRYDARYRPVATEIVVVPAAGGAARVLGQGRGPSWSPDGRRVAYVGRRDLVAVVNRDGSGLVANGAARARPDTTWIPPRGDPDAARQTWTSNVAWSPDGRALAFVGTDGDLYTVSPGGGAPVHVGPHGLQARGHLAWSRDGTRLAFAGEGIGVLDLAAGTVHRLETNPAAAQPAWSADGNRVAYALRVNVVRSDVLVRPAGGGPAVDVVAGPSEDVDPAWRPGQ